MFLLQVFGIVNPKRVPRIIPGSELSGALGPRACIKKKRGGFEHWCVCVSGKRLGRSAWRSPQAYAFRKGPEFSSSQLLEVWTRPGILWLLRATTREATLVRQPGHYLNRIGAFKVAVEERPWRARGRCPQRASRHCRRASYGARFARGAPSPTDVSGWCAAHQQSSLQFVSSRRPSVGAACGGHGWGPAGTMPCAPSDICDLRDLCCVLSCEGA